MSDQVLNWDFTTSEDEGGGGQSPPNRGDVSGLLTDSTTLAEPYSWVQTPGSLDLSKTQVDNFPDVFQALSNVELHSTPPLEATIEKEEEILHVLEKGEYSGTERKSNELVHQRTQSEGNDRGTELRRKQDNQRPKRTRSTEIHNISERRRRDRIKEKMRTLQELIPFCHKSDRVSMLDGAIEYIKALKHQVHVISVCALILPMLMCCKWLVLHQMMSMGGGAQCQASNMLPRGYQNMQLPQFFPFMPNRPRTGMEIGMGYGMRMCNIPCSTSLSMILVPSTSLHLSQSAAAGLPLLSGLGVLPAPHVQLVPFNPSQQVPAADPTPNVPQRFTSTFDSSNKRESNCPTVQSGSVATVPASQIIPLSTLSCKPVAVEACGADSSQWKEGETSKSGD